MSCRHTGPGGRHRRGCTGSTRSGQGLCDCTFDTAVILWIFRVNNITLDKRREKDIKGALTLVFQP